MVVLFGILIFLIFYGLVDVGWLKIHYLDSIFFSAVVKNTKVEAVI